jgi:hypothetical protein
VVEIDRTRESMENLIAKFREQYAWAEWRRREWDEEHTTAVLVVTTSWQRSGTIRAAVLRAQPFAARTLALWVSTFKELEAHGISAPIWRSIEDWRHMQHLPCFDEKAKNAAAPVA